MDEKGETQVSNVLPNPTIVGYRDDQVWSWSVDDPFVIPGLLRVS
jgi:hypothetical protein